MNLAVRHKTKNVMTQSNSNGTKQNEIIHITQTQLEIDCIQ